MNGGGTIRPRRGKSACRRYASSRMSIGHWPQCCMACCTSSTRSAIAASSPLSKFWAAMVYYIDAFPERFHHPKEDGYLFLRLRARCPEARPVLDQLEAEHLAGGEKIRSLEQALARYQQGGEAGRREPPPRPCRITPTSTGNTCGAREKEVLPLAAKHLTPSDWDADRCSIPWPRRSAGQ